MLSVASPPSSLRGGIPCHLIPCAFGRDPCMSSRLKGEESAHTREDEDEKDVCG